MRIWHYHPATRELLGAGEADPSPLEPGEWLIPAYATTVEPPAVGAQEVAVYDGVAWVVMPDHRGTVYYLPDGSRHEITAIGIEPPADALTEPPPPPPPPVPLLADVKAAAAAVIDAAAGAARARYITVTAGQDATYLAKAAQAEAYAAAGYPADLTTYGYIEAELARLGLDPANASDRRAACDGILAIRAQWLAIDAIIERHRLVGKARVQAAADHAAVAAERDAAVAALDEI